MTKRKLFIIPAIFCLALAAFLPSCLDGETKTTYIAYGVMKYDSGGKISGLAVSTSDGMLAMHDNAALRFDEGACIYAQLEVDSENQPSSEYTTATLLDYEETSPYAVIASGSPVDENYMAIISDIPVLVGNPNYYGNIMIYTHHVASSKQEFAYQLVNNPEETYTTDEGETVYKFYLQARAKNEEGTSKVDLYPFISFNLNSFITQYGHDTTVSGTNYRTINFDLHYIEKMSDEGEPVFAKLNTSGMIVVSIYK